MEPTSLSSVRRISRYLEAESSPIIAIRHVVYIWCCSADRCYFLEDSRLLSFPARGLPIDAANRRLAELGLVAISADEVACFCWGMRGKRRLLCTPSPNGRNNPGCPLQAARIIPGDKALITDLLDTNVLPKLPRFADLREVTEYLVGDRGIAVRQHFKLDSVLFYLLERRLTGSGVDLAELTPEQVIGDLNLAATGQGEYYPCLDDQSSFGEAFCRLMLHASEDDEDFVGGPGGILQLQLPVELPAEPPGRVTSEPVHCLM